jgi:orotidine-5'-phosphate decarboxylase
MVILDGKRNDIGTTAQAYAEAYLGPGTLSPWGADALTVSPYLGEDSLEPFIERCQFASAGIFVLVKTSNPGSGQLQDLVVEQKSIAERVADWVESQSHSLRGTSGYGPVGAVVGATYPEELARMRERMPSAWILIPGYGAQGGAARDVAAGFDHQGLGALVNSSRGIIFAHASDRYRSLDRWQAAVESATREMIAELDAALPQLNGAAR